MGDKEDRIAFHCDSDPATGSILAYQHSSDDLASIKQHKVQLSTMDHYFQLNPISQTVSVIKIDTQGYDLHVLKGAAQTIQHHRPWLIVELIFVPLYENQTKPHDITTWLETQGYALTGIFNSHYSADGWLSFADGVFVPSNITQSFKAPFFMNQSNAELLVENAMLHTVCEERLQLINRLHDEAARLQERNLI